MKKSAQKKTAEKIDIPTLPWVVVKEGDRLDLIAKKIGFPLLIKASAGGGGKGMRRVEKKEDLESAAEAASLEAKAAFGDGTLFIERLLEGPRHIEVQIFGDGKGGGVHLYERDCSLQRRHQKVWEEAPALGLSKKTKEGLYESSLRLLKETKYESAGTIEFLVDSEENYFFLEMNTRLQVEHPVTELVTGVDLVRAQLLQALGSGESLRQIPHLRGVAIEARIYAEDPSQAYLPSPGRVEKLHWPTGAGIRVDSGIEEGQVIGTQFDPMLAKLIVLGDDRSHALSKMRYALEELVILGLGTNQAFLRFICDHSKVIHGGFGTDFLDREMEFLLKPTEEQLDLLSQSQNLRFQSRSFSTEKHPSAWNAFGRAK